MRVYAFDPSLARSPDTAEVNEVTLRVPWEGKPDGSSTLQPGPIGEYLEVVDVDPPSACVYDPVDLDEHRLLATDGIAPYEGDPRFHQQMGYAVGMNVIDHFERALGRPALWASRRVPGQKKDEVEEHFVPRLRIYPHALREANAYYKSRPESPAVWLLSFRVGRSPDLPRWDHLYLPLP